MKLDGCASMSWLTLQQLEGPAPVLGIAGVMGNSKNLDPAIQKQAKQQRRG